MSHYSWGLSVMEKGWMRGGGRGEAEGVGPFPAFVFPNGPLPDNAFSSPSHSQVRGRGC